MSAGTMPRVLVIADGADRLGHMDERRLAALGTEVDVVVVQPDELDQVPAHSPFFWTEEDEAALSAGYRRLSREEAMAALKPHPHSAVVLRAAEAKRARKAAKARAQSRPTDAGPARADGGA